MAKLAAEKKELLHLKSIYDKAAQDIAKKLEISNGKINVLLKDFDNLDEVQKSILQSQIYQRNFQLSLKKQIDGFLKDINADQYESIDQYMKECYKTGFLGSMYDLHGQGIPIVTPIDQKQIAEAIKINSKISKKLYKKLGEDVDFLKKRIANNIARGIATASEYKVIARNIAADSNMGFNRAMRIARTEGHGMQCQAAETAQHAAKKAGADVLKQWNAALDKRTRASHARLDGEIRELDEKFSNGMMRPADKNGVAAEVVNCRCALLQRARWALDEDELQTLKDRAAYYGLDKTDNFNDFSKKYLKAVESSGKSSKIEVPKRYKNATSDKLEAMGVTYNQVEARKAAITFEEIVDKLGGGDKTSGSCASVGLAYIGQKYGYDVLDFRGGDSMKFFSSKLNKVELFKNLGVKSIVEDSFKSNISNGKKILSRMEVGKEYYLSVGRHAAIVRMTEDGFQYLELQSPSNNGWKNFSKDVKETLKWRFGCTSSTRYYPTAFLTDIEQLKGNNEFIDVLGYINTSTNEQKKGVSGNVK